MGWLKTLGKIATIAAPIAAAPFTGGTSLALIGAGAGAAKGALSGGGLRGALLGGALGSVPGLGGAGAVGGQVAKAGLKSTLLNTVLPAATALGSTLGAVGDARAQGRQEQAKTNQAQDQLKLQAQIAQQNAMLNAAQQRSNTQTNAADIDLKQKQDARQAPGDILSNALKGGAAARIQDAHMNRPNGVPNMSFSGGLRPSLIGDAGRQAGSEMERQALEQMMNPAKYAELPTADPQLMSMFKPTDLPEAGVLDKILSGAGTIGAVGTGVSQARDAISKIIAQNAPKLPPPQGMVPGVTPLGPLSQATIPRATLPLQSRPISWG
jgi:hypothetical protein